MMNSRYREQNGGCQGPEGGEMERCTLKDTNFQLQDEEVPGI